MANEIKAIKVGTTEYAVRDDRFGTENGTTSLASGTLQAATVQNKDGTTARTIPVIVQTNGTTDSALKKVQFKYDSTNKVLDIILTQE